MVKWALLGLCNSAIIHRIIFRRWIQILSAHSDHCGSTECRIGVTLVLGEIGVTRANPYLPVWPGSNPPPLPAPSALGLFRTPPRPAAVTQIRGRLGTCLLPSGRRPPCPDCIRRWGWGLTCGGDRKGIGCLTYSTTCRFGIAE